MMHEKFEPGKVSKLSTCMLCSSEYILKLMKEKLDYVYVCVSRMGV